MSVPKHATSEPSIGELVKDISTHLSTVVHGEIELAKLEIKTSARLGVVGISMFVVAAVLVLYSLTFGLIALAQGLITAGIWTWAAYLIVFALLLVVAAIIAFFGYRQVQRVRAPERTIETTKSTIDAVKSAAAHPELSSPPANG